MKRMMCALAFCGGVFSLTADEGMWLFNQPPLAQLRERHQFEATGEWLEHLQKSSINFGGGSGSLVSEDGLLISNHHIGAGTLHRLDSPEKNYLRDGYNARRLADELPCPDLRLDVLESITDVTARVNAAVPPKVSPSGAFAARREIITEIEQESLDRTGLRSHVVTLWQGGAYHLYRYHRYSDVRLVFAPEQAIGAFGGDVENFEFPRHDLDICLFRLYENGHPAKVKQFLRFNPAGAAEGDLVFVSGHPGNTDRLLTVAELKDQRDRAMPARLDSLKRQEVLFGNWCARSEENSRRAKPALSGVQNGRKALDGRLAGLLGPDILPAIEQAETGFKARLAGKPEFATALAAYERIARATRVLADQSARSALIEGGEAFNCESFGLARTLLRAPEESAKPNGSRLHEFIDSEREMLERGLFSGRPIYADVEILRLADALTHLAGQLGAENELVRKILAGRSPHDRAVDLIKGTQVREVAFRRKLYQGGAAALATTHDPMIELARLVDADARALRSVTEEIGEIKHQAHAAIAAARNQLLGTDGYPDATGSLRLSFGKVQGYEESGAPVPAMTTLGSVFEKSAAMKQREPFNLPAAWERRKSALDKNIPFNFVSTCDIIGGNSGSPVVNRAGEFVGIIFDGNLQSLSGDIAYNDRQGRAIAVHAAAILEALDKVYGARDLVHELVAGHRR